jgi:hypothetical protein
MEHVIDIKDTRKASRIAKAPLTFDRDAAEIILAVTGVEVGPETTIKLRITDQAKGQQGYARRIGPDAFLVKIRVAKQAQYGDSHHYVLNNSLVHELRHVAQMQVTPGFEQAYALETGTKGYRANAFEAEAREFGRLADHTGTKTSTKGKPMGKALWALNFGGIS